MEYRCEDLPQYGVVLIPPSSPDYAALLADIQKRQSNPIPGSEPKPADFEDPSAPTMILCNRSQTAIAELSWIWKFELETGQTMRSSSMISAGDPSVLAPFGLGERERKLYGYWHVILPGSKRGIRGGSMFGDNTDVRLPQIDELWKGGVLVSGSGRYRLRGPLKSVTLTLDGVFFMDGGFAGPDTFHSFDRITADVDAHLQVARIARDGHNKGLAAATIFTQIEAVTGPNRGPAPPPPSMGEARDFRQDSLRTLASQISMMRQYGDGDERVIYSLMSWTETPLPNFRRL
jgi:hypothetical protein